MRPLTTKQIVLGFVAFFGTICSVLANAALSMKGEQGPLAPDVRAGLVAPFYDHGTVHYVSRSLDMWTHRTAEAQMLFMLMLAAVAVWVIATRKQT